MSLLAILAALATTSGHSTTYDCQAEKQLVLMSDKGEWNYSASDVDKDSRDTFRWTFVATRAANGAITVSHDPGILDAVGVGGDYPAMSLAPGQFAFSTNKSENCLFTELGCGALVEISDIDKRKASFSLTPMGSVIMEDERREILQLIMLGTCKKSESKQ
ncbi:hypothetical protein [Pontixanthobacter aquaemixtae]|uniref:Uncharacterized protein n=1 Tax=Pontixanthobacter aquaemixtae TaxID=1958940 RepID=A0A844ZS74_9SPHN|nr:hypothetical protein [Pontixanthobacter aquaemixtae]MXO90344.1 hypothetical protein [Pontixanthobacter aquaemixtae]